MVGRFRETLCALSCLEPLKNHDFSGLLRMNDSQFWVSVRTSVVYSRSTWSKPFIRSWLESNFWCSVLFVFLEMLSTSYLITIYRIWPHAIFFGGSIPKSYILNPKPSAFIGPSFGFLMLKFSEVDLRVLAGCLEG